ncbi:hypothetical protein I6F26_26415 [Ensifer sp. IC3342]|nr:hypothetical protein [Ensifer sp. BRP08]MCA1450094.1 hypothetical protein [Ensifer sp. IC3342]
MTLHHEVPMDEHSAVRSYFLKIDGPVTKLAIDAALADLLATEFLTEGAFPAEILDLHHAVLQLSDSL